MRTFYITLFVSIALMVGGFFAPPLGQIDGSVLTAVGFLLMFATIAQIPQVLEALKTGRSVKIQKGDFSAELNASEHES